MLADMPPRSSRATMKDVAALARVSPKTVSNVVTGSAQVSEPTRQRVEDAMRQLDFVPNLSARTLRNGRTGIIGLALPDLATAFSADLTHAVVQEAHRRGQAVQIEETAAEPDREHDLVSRARAHLIDGLILNPVRLEDSAVEHEESLPPVVLIGEVEQTRTDRVFIDSRRAAEEVTAHMLSRGARRLVALGGAERGERATATARLRLQGFRDAHAAAGLPAAAERELGVWPWSIGGGADAVEQLVAAGVEFDGLVAFTDSIAMGARHALHRHGLSVPDDVLLSGFDDVEHAAYSIPPLTTVGFDHHDYAVAALDLLAARLDDRSRATRAEPIEHRLIIRGSTGVPGAAPRGHRPV